MQVLLEKPRHLGVEKFVERRAIEAGRIDANLRRLHSQAWTAGRQEVVMTSASYDMIFWRTQQGEAHRLFTTGVQLVVIVRRAPELDWHSDIFQSHTSRSCQMELCVPAYNRLQLARVTTKEHPNPWANWQQIDSFTVVIGCGWPKRFGDWQMHNADGSEASEVRSGSISTKLQVSTKSPLCLRDSPSKLTSVIGRNGPEGDTTASNWRADRCSKYILWPLSRDQRDNAVLCKLAQGWSHERATRA